MVIEIIVTDGVDGRALWQVLQDSVVVAEGREACEQWLVANGREWRLSTEDLGEFSVISCFLRADTFQWVVSGFVGIRD